jgi:hypothetical protein
MRVRHWLIAMAVLPVGGIGGAFAGAILSPTAVVGDTLGTGAGKVGHLIDQSGLSAPFISGATDFDTYVATNPTHAGLTGANGWASANNDTSGYLEFDLGSVYAITAFAMWTQNNPSAIDSFSLSTAMDSAFTTGVANLGSFTGTKTLTVQTFDVSAVGEFVRLQVNSTFGGTNVDIGEVAFDVATVPEPATFAIVGMGLAAIAALRRPRALRPGSPP